MWCTKWNSRKFKTNLLSALLKYSRTFRLQFSYYELKQYIRSRQMDWPSLSSSLVNPICPCGGKTTKKQKTIVSSVLLPVHIGYNRYSYYYKIQGFFCILTYVFGSIHFESARTVLWLPSTRLHDWTRSIFLFCLHF